MSKLRWAISWLRVGQSKERGDYEHMGWFDQQGETHPVVDQTGYHMEASCKAAAGDFHRAGTIRQLLQDVYKYNCLIPYVSKGMLCGMSAEDAEVSHALQIFGVTDSTLRRIARLVEDI